MVRVPTSSSAPIPQKPPEITSESTLRPVDKRVASRVLSRLGLLTTSTECRPRQVPGEGKDKLIVEHEDQSKVYMLPQASFLSRCKRNIEAEVEFIKGVVSALKQIKGGDTTNLAVDITQTEGKKGVWEMGKAAGNLEKKVLEKQDWQTCKSFCRDIVNGMTNLHKAGFVHGDMKLENMLLFPGKTEDDKPYIKVSDFGKGAKVVENESGGVYSGNTRYGPPEGIRSKKGDVYGAGICLIRMLEEQVLTSDEKSLPTDNRAGTKIPPAHKDRRGVERFILEHPAFRRSYEQKGSFAGKVLDFCARVRTVTGRVTEKELKAEQKALNGYIDQLCLRLRNKTDLTDQQLGSLKLVLRGMTDPNPDTRLDMVVAQDIIRTNIFPMKQPGVS